jgi:hypothetical protein
MLAMAPPAAVLVCVPVPRSVTRCANLLAGLFEYLTEQTLDQLPAPCVADLPKHVACCHLPAAVKHVRLPGGHSTAAQGAAAILQAHLWQACQAAQQAATQQAVRVPRRAAAARPNRL